MSEGDGMSQVCVHCGWFIEYRLPKAPAEPGWVHTLYRPDPPSQGPCNNPEPEEQS